MADVAQLLATLHPLREPPQPASVLPYLLMLAAGAAAAGLVVALRVRGRRRGLRAAAVAGLAASRRLDPAERLAAQAALLRRLVRAAGGEARTDGAAWLAALDRTFATTFFSQGAGRAFAETLYRRSPDIDLDQLDRTLGRLIAGAKLDASGRSRPSWGRAGRSQA